MEEELIKKKNKKLKINKTEKITNILFDVLVVISIIIMAIAVAPKALQNDTFYNIKCGEYILQNGILNLTQDPFSWHNLSYTWPHWLYDLFSYIIFHFSRKSLGIWILYNNNNIYSYFGNYFI